MPFRAIDLIIALGLEPHPEGGYYRRIYTSTLAVEPADGRPRRAALTTIYYLLVKGQVSAWHRVASDEAWHFLEGEPLEMFQADPELQQIGTTILGPYAENINPVDVVPAGHWQAARPAGAFALVACTVGPGFDYSDFELMRDHPERAAALKRKHPEFGIFL